MADGTYTGDGNRDINFRGKGITVRSANGPETCILDLEASYWEMHRAFLFQDNEDRTSILQGFTITNGDNSWFSLQGGAIYCLGASPTIVDNVITDCGAGYGGGIYCEGGSPSIIRNTFSDNVAYINEAPGTPGKGGAIALFSGAEPLISENTFSGNRSSEAGGAIYSRESSPIITENQFDGNWTSPAFPDLRGDGGTIYCLNGGLVEDNQIDNGTADDGGGVHASGSVIIRGNVFEDNSGHWGGGAIHAHGPVQIRDNLILRSRADDILSGAGIHFTGTGGVATGNIIMDTLGTAISNIGGPVTVENTLLVNYVTALFSLDEIVIRSCTIVDNLDPYGPTIFLFGNTTISDSIIWGNSPDGEAIRLQDAELSIHHCDLEGAQTSIELINDAALNWGPGMIDSDPLFIEGVDGFHYLSQTAAGQAIDSPCLDRGSASAADLGLDRSTTRTDLVPDSGTVDMGYHSPAPGNEPDTMITGGTSGTTDSPIVCFSFSGIDDTDPPSSLTFSHRLDSGPWSDYSAQTDACYEDVENGSHTFEVRSRDAEGNVDPSPAVRVFATIPWDKSGWTGLVTGPGPGPLNPPLVRTPLAQWAAYGVYRHGVNVACGDLDGDGTAEVVTGPGPGPVFGPHVRGWELDGTPLAGVNYIAYGTLKYGVNVACGDIDGDGFDEIVTGAGPGAVFGPHVRGWNYDGSASTTALPEVSFFAYGTLKYGVNVACGDLDGDGFDEIVSGAGPGAVFGPHVRAWNWDGDGSVIPIQGISYFAYGTLKWGVNVACGDLDGDGMDEIVTGPGPGSIFGAHVRGWNSDGGPATPIPGINFFAYTSNHGCAMGAGDIDGDDIDEILTMPGPGPEMNAHLRAWNANGGSVTIVPEYDFLAYDEWYTHGGRVAGVVMAIRRRSSGPHRTPSPATLPSRTR